MSFGILRQWKRKIHYYLPVIVLADSHCWIWTVLHKIMCGIASPVGDVIFWVVGILKSLDVSHWEYLWRIYLASGIFFSFCFLSDMRRNSSAGHSCHHDVIPTCVELANFGLDPQKSWTKISHSFLKPFSYMLWTAVWKYIYTLWNRMDSTEDSLLCSMLVSSFRRWKCRCWRRWTSSVCIWAKHFMSKSKLQIWKCSHRSQMISSSNCH